jgi:hypothetical protein
MPAPNPISALRRIEQKLDTLTALIERQLALMPVSPRWWVDHAGRFENDPAFDEMMRLARKQRKQRAKPQTGTSQKAR